MTKVFFLNSTLADYGEEEFNYLQKFLLEQGVLHTQGADWASFEDLEVLQNGTPDMSVNVGIGSAVIETVRSGVTFKVFVYNSVIENLAIGNNGGGSNRVDAVVLKISRSTEPNALMNNVATLEVVAGSSAVALTDGAIDTALGADFDWIRLADVTVAPAETTILDADVADTRSRVLTTDAIQYSPTVLKFKVLTADPTVKVEGDLWYNSTDNVMRYYDGSGVINVEAGSFTGGDGIDITGGVISLDTEDDSGMEFSGGKVKILGTQNSNIAGENISGATLPVPVYQDVTDFKLYKCIANDVGKISFIGFAVTTAVTDGAIVLQSNGQLGGFTGLTIGSNYYLTNTSGIISTTAGTYNVPVGVAVSATEILLFNLVPLTAIPSDTIRASSDTDQRMTGITAVKKKEVEFLANNGTVRIAFDIRTDNWGYGQGQVYKNGSPVGVLRQNNTQTFVNYSEDIAFSKGDLIQLYLSSTQADGTAEAKNFRVYYNESVVPKHSTVILD
jgi:hypothetical protein